MAEKSAPAPLPPPSSVPQVLVPSGISLGSLRGIGKVFATRREEHEQENETQPAVQESETEHS
jgi:hypothetical protein